jgi:hypothetical protein
VRRMQEKQGSVQKTPSVVLCKSCGGRRCPEVTQDQGDFVLFDVDQAAPGSVRMTREQAEILRDYLQDQLSR